MNRLYSKTYTNAPAGTLSNCYLYDNPASGSNGIGKLWQEWTQAGSCTSAPPANYPNYQSLRVYAAYDAMGRIAAERQCAAGYCTTVPSQPTANCTSLTGSNGLQYCYDMAGNLLAYSNGLTTAAAANYPQAALAFSQTFDGTGRLNTTTSSWSDSTHPQELFSAQTYTPFNSLSSWLVGGQLWTNRTYDTRLRVTCQWSFTENQTPSHTCP